MPQNTGTLSAPKHNTAAEDALIALVNLGINRNVAELALKKIENASALSVEDLIKQALRAL
jgi:Holliday junction resolvasome RuvABC DNA-binding subunit